MKTIVLFLLLTLSTAHAQAQAPENMRLYVMGFLKRGPAWTAEKTPAAEALTQKHLANLQRLWKMGFLLGAGPTSTDTSALREVLIFDADSLEAMREETELDPAVRAGRYTTEFHKWYSLKGIGRAHAESLKNNSSWKAKRVMYQFGILVKDSAWTPNDGSPALKELQEKHLAHLTTLLNSGMMRLAGPFMDDGDIRGISIFKAGSIAEAQALADADPAVRARRLKMILLPWVCEEGIIP